MLTLLAVAALSFSDPAGDALGNSAYTLPTRPAVSADALDLRSVDAQPGTEGLTFRVGLGKIENPWQAPSGYSSGVIDIFVGGPGKSAALPQLRLNTQDGDWLYHAQITGFGTRLEKREQGEVRPLSDPTLSVDGTQLVLETNIPAAEYLYWVTSSVYSPLSADGYLAPSTTTAPTALHSNVANAPVPVDVLAPDGNRSAYDRGELRGVGELKDYRPWILGGVGGLGLLLVLLATTKIWRER